MAWADPVVTQDPTTNVIALAAWGDVVNGDLNFLRAAKAGCRLSSVVGTATGTDTVLPWGTEVYDVNACHDNAVNTSRITVPATWAGLWYVGADVTMSSGAFAATIVVNAATRLVVQASNTVGAVDSAVSLDTIYEMAVGDYFEVWITGGTSRSTATSSFMYAHWLASDA